MGFFGEEFLRDKCQISNRDRQLLKKRFPLWVGGILALYLYINLGRPKFLAEITIGFVLFIAIFFMNHFLGYWAFAVTVLMIALDSVGQLFLWARTGASYRIVFIGMSLITLTASAIIAHTAEKEKKTKRSLELLSVTDGMTQLYNHSFFEKRLGEEISLAEKSNEPLVLCMLDIDQFKEFNDARGHAGGDEALKMTARVLRSSVRSTDIVCRYGGDEFAIIFLNADPEEAIKTLEAVKAAYREESLSFTGFDDSFHLTLSIGLTSFPDLAGNKDELMLQADSALYYAKNLGRDRVELYQRKSEKLF